YMPTCQPCHGTSDDRIHVGGVHWVAEVLSHGEQLYRTGMKEIIGVLQHAIANGILRMTGPDELISVESGTVGGFQVLISDARESDTFIQFESGSCAVPVARSEGRGDEPVIPER